MGAALLTASCLSREAIREIEGSAAQEGTGIFLSRLPQVIKILATYEATDHQRKVAEERARRIFAQIHEDLAAGRRADRPAILAVETEPDERLQGKSTVLLWDTQTEEIIGNKVYDVEELPSVGEVARWESYSALYAGR